MNAMTILCSRWPISGPLLAGILLAAACSGSPSSPKDDARSSAAEQAAVAPNQSGQTDGTPAVVEGLLKVEPDVGVVGDEFTVSGDGFAPGAEVTFAWVTATGSFETVVMAETVEFHQPTYAEARVVLGSATADAQGGARATFTVPEDFGGPHDIYAVVDGEDVARGGFQINRHVTVSPTEGPVGTPIAIRVTGLGSHALERAMAVRYGNAYTGFITGVTTSGTAVATIRAAGPPGLHTIELSGLGIHGGGYLNNQQSPYARLFPPDGAYRFIFRVTEDAGPPPNEVVWPDEGRTVQLERDAPRTTATGTAAGSTVDARITPPAGPILTQARLDATGLPADVEFDILWVTARGNRVTASGWNLEEIPLTTAQSDGSGALSATIEIPEGLGGWHVVLIAHEGVVRAEVPFYVMQSFVAVTPERVRVGEEFTIQLKGIGWTELDNTVAITYNNAYIGYACGFNSDGDITLHLVASGQPGTHLIDIYPTVYQGSGKRPWGFQMPHLNAPSDHPSLGLGYMLPIYRLAIEVVDEE
ncbi:MAG: hypothetical protein Kow0010_16730 [Dehalococcoidia bacterium]